MDPCSTNREDDVIEREASDELHPERQPPKPPGIAFETGGSSTGDCVEQRNPHADGDPATGVKNLPERSR